MGAEATDLDALFAAPLEGFIAERDRIAKELAASGDTDAAKAVRSLRKPSIVVWTLNQLARARADDLEALFEIGADMRRSLEEGDPKGARDAQAARRSQLKRLGDAAGEILRGQGRAASSGQIEKVRSILLQATTEEGVAKAVSEGRLTKDPSSDALPDIFDDLGAMALAGEPAEDARTRDRRARLEQRVDELRIEAEGASQQATRLARDAESARLAADAADDLATAAQRAADRALKHLEDAEKRLRDER